MVAPLYNRLSTAVDDSLHFMRLLQRQERVTRCHVTETHYAASLTCSIVGRQSIVLTLSESDFDERWTHHFLHRQALTEINFRCC